MQSIAPRVIVVAVAATFALAGCGRDDNRASSTNLPGSATGTTGGTASSPTTPGSTPSPSGGGSAMSGGGAAPSGSTGASANGGLSSPSGTTGRAMSNDSGSDRAMSGSGGGAPSIPAGGTAAANDGTTAPAGSTGSDTRGAAGGTSGAGTSGGAPGAGSSSAGGSTGGSGSGAATGSPTPPSTPGKSSSLDSTVISAHVVPTADTSVASGELSRADKSFIEEAASGGLTEVEVGKMMAQRATHPGVREFAERLVKDHTQANEELRRIAANYGVSLPATPDAKHRAMVEKLANEKGAELDREFLRTFGVKEHQKDIKDFQKQAQSGDNGELKAFAAKTLPKLQEHQAMAQRLEQELARK